MGDLVFPAILAFRMRRGHGQPAVRLKYIWVPPALLLALSLFTLAAWPPQET